jgi:hypothetical protein
MSGLSELSHKLKINFENFEKDWFTQTCVKNQQSWAVENNSLDNKGLISYFLLIKSVNL